MKECERISDLFGELHEEGVGGPTQIMAKNHLEECACCREDFQWYRLTVQALASLEKVSPPPDFMSQLHTKLYSSPSFSIWDYLRNLFSYTPHLPLPVGAAALVGVVAVGLILYSGLPPEVASLESPWQYDQGTARTPYSGATTVAQTGMRAKPLAPGIMPVSKPVENPPAYAMTPPNRIENHVELANDHGGTIADRIGADNLTVESPAIDNAVASLKKILPEIQGKLVDEKHRRGGVEEKILAVVIPSGAYPDLTTELINHGAVAAGAGADVNPPVAKKDGNNVLLYIRFVNRR